VLAVCSIHPLELAAYKKCTDEFILRTASGPGRNLFNSNWHVSGARRADVALQFGESALKSTENLALAATIGLHYLANSNRMWKALVLSQANPCLSSKTGVCRNVLFWPLGLSTTTDKQNL
jgi:hypothetical protein